MISILSIRQFAERYADRLFKDSEQDTNDLTKAVRWCIRKGYKEIVILGATGKREDHTVGNISLLTEYAREINVIMVTDTGTLTPLLASSLVTSFPGQQISIFSVNPETEITSTGLKYPLKRFKPLNWWAATLNESEGYSFESEFREWPVDRLSEIHGIRVLQVKKVLQVLHSLTAGH